MKFNGTLIITDPCYIINKSNDGDWHKCDYGDGMEKLGITNYLSSSTGCGDWSCTTLKGKDTDQTVDDYLCKRHEIYSKGLNDRNQPNITQDDITSIYDQYKKDLSELDRNNVVLGEFCADSGMVGVFLLDEVLKYNPEFDYHINKVFTTTLISGFEGDVVIEPDPHNDGNVRVRGSGNFDFFTTQTGM